MSERFGNEHGMSGPAERLDTTARQQLAKRPGACRACRQPEFSQLDMEMTFMDQEAIMLLAEGLVRAAFLEASTFFRLVCRACRLLHTAALHLRTIAPCHPQPHFEPPHLML